MKRGWTVAATGILCAFIASLAGTPGGYEYYRFKTRDYLREREIFQIKDTIKYFSASIAGFYATGGATAEGLNMFPSEKMIKRRIFQDINNWRSEGKVLVMDRDKSTVKEVTFITPERAVAVVDENWFNAYQDSATRRPLSGNKADLIRVRYFLKKVWGKWIVAEYEVYTQREPLPPLSAQRLPAW